MCPSNTLYMYVKNNNSNNQNIVILFLVSTADAAPMMIIDDAPAGSRSAQIENSCGRHCNSKDLKCKMKPRVFWRILEF